MVKDSKSNPLLAFEKMAQSYEYLLGKEYTHEDLSSEIGALEQIQEQIRGAFYGSYRELHEQLKRILIGKNEKELPMGEAESKNAVHIMNAHFAKGLEANIVILACPAYEAPGFMDKVIVEEVIDSKSRNKHRTGYVEVCLDSIYAKSSYHSNIGVSKSFADKAEVEKILHDEEEVRLLYVAGTRAKECLIIADSDYKKGDVWRKLSKGVGDIDISDPTLPQTSSFTDEELTVFVRKAVAAGLESERLSIKQCERLLIEEDKRNELATASVGKQQEELTKHMLPELKKFADAIMQDEEFRNDLMAAKAIYTELPFELNLDAAGIAGIAPDIKDGYEEGQAVHVRGTMDLLLELEDRFVIWDYKSDVIRTGEGLKEFEERLRESYAPQLRIYVEALKCILASDEEKKEKKIETKLYHREFC